MQLTIERRQLSTLVETPRSVQKGPQMLHGLIWPILNLAPIQPLYQIPSQTKLKIKGRCSRYQRAFQIFRNSISNRLQHKLYSFETVHLMHNFPPQFSIVQSIAINKMCLQSFASSVLTKNSSPNPRLQILSMLRSVHSMWNSPFCYLTVQSAAFNQMYVRSFT